MGDEGGLSRRAGTRRVVVQPWMLSAPSLRPRWIAGPRHLRHPLTHPLLSYGTEYHTPVMVREALSFLRPERGGVFLDGTLGGGGHTEAILGASDGAMVIGVDRDPDALAEAAGRLARFGRRFRIVGGNFANAVEAAGIEAGGVDGILLDLGISSHQVDAAQRGFTFRPGAPLDMRMEGAFGFESAADLLNSMDEEELASVFYRYGEEKRSRRLARVIAEMRSAAPLQRSDDLSAAIDRVIPRATPQDRARIFQAVRIAVNEEVSSLEIALPRLRDALAPGGVFVVLSYHSLEDRIVKDAFREWSRDCVCPPGLPICRCRGAALGSLLTRKPMMATAREVELNSRARSARLRAWRKA
jgi:16S rRNA (cytosine1402-N4)-methyltransferase